MEIAEKFKVPRGNVVVHGCPQCQATDLDVGRGLCYKCRKIKDLLCDDCWAKWQK